jgi:hypothetical protein
LHPSRNPSVAHLGGALAGFLRGRPSPRPDLPDLAALEWARAEAFIAADAVPEDIAALERVGEALPGARLELVPSVRLVSVRYDAAGLWADLEAQREPPRPVESARSLLVWRKGFQVFHARIGQEELAALSAVQRGAPLGEACEAFAGIADPAKAALQALSSWFGEGLVARVIA